MTIYKHMTCAMQTLSRALLLRPLSVKPLKVFITNMAEHALEDIAFQTKLEKYSKRLAPSLSLPSYKGQAGKVGIFGGSFEYTGAPYFAAISALKVGADLVHVFCTAEAAVPLKCYSPELIVHPLLAPGGIDKIKEWLARLDVVIIGPGMGRSQPVFDIIEEIIPILKSTKKPVIFDADALYLITQNPSLLHGFTSPVILTPNKMELARLLHINDPSKVETADVMNFLTDSNHGDSVLIFSKGENDGIFTVKKPIVLRGMGGSRRRCGGQGDILAGSLAVFLNWSKGLREGRRHAACYAAAKLVRDCNARAFARKGRSMTATDMIEEIHKSFQKHFEIAE